MQKVKMDGFVRINKTQARRVYERGTRVYVTHHKLRPANYYSWMPLEKRDDYYWPDHLYKTQFDYRCMNWKIYNACYEWGYYPSFYVEVSNDAA